MIVKVQLSQFDSEGRKMMLMYDKARKYELEMEAPEEFIKLMGDEPKKFFHAKLVPDDRPGYEGSSLIDIGEPAPWQNW
jgi:hypothetical protein